MVKKIINQLKNSEKKTIDVYRNDTDYLDGLRTTDLGTVSYADIVKKVCEVYRTVI